MLIVWGGISLEHAIGRNMDQRHVMGRAPIGESAREQTVDPQKTGLGLIKMTVCQTDRVNNSTRPQVLNYSEVWGHCIEFRP
jgi:hypothetical protein